MDLELERLIDDPTSLEGEFPNKEKCLPNSSFGGFPSCHRVPRIQVDYFALLYFYIFVDHRSPVIESMMTLLRRNGS